MPPARFSIGLVERLARRSPACAPCLRRRSFRRMASLGTQFSLERGQADGQTLPTSLITDRDAQLLRDAARAAAGGPRIRATDRLDTPPVAIVNETFAARYLAGRDPVGQRSDARQPRSAAAVGDHRRRRRRLPQQRPHAAGAARDLHARAAADRVESAVHVDPHRGIAGGADASRAAGHLVTRSPNNPSYLIQTLDDATGGVDVPAANRCAAGRHLCRRGGAARGDWHLRRHVLCRQRAHAGDGRAPGARRAARATCCGSSLARYCGCPRSGLTLGIAILLIAGRAARAAALRRACVGSAHHRRLLRSCWRRWRSSRRGPPPPARAGSIRFRPCGTNEGDRCTVKSDAGSCV